MKILAIDTTAKTATGAICEDENVLDSFQITAGLTHSETMLPEIDKLFEKTSFSPDDIDLFAVSSGPGSFTGVRIGVALIKGLAFGKGKPCVGVSTLEALCRGGAPIGGDFIACGVMDARRSQLYSATFSCSGGEFSRLCEDRLISSGDLARELSEFSLPVYFFGDGYEIARGAFPTAKETPPELIYQNAASVADVARRIYLASDNRSAFTDVSLSPTYLRASQAEREYNNKENKS